MPTRAHGRRSRHQRHLDGAAGAQGDGRTDQDLLRRRVATGMDDREMIEIGGETGDWEHDRRTVSRAELIGIMRPGSRKSSKRCARGSMRRVRAPAQPADRADRRRQPDPRARRAGQPHPRPAGAPRPAACACMACRRPRPGPAFASRWACASSRPTRRTNGGISTCRRSLPGPVAEARGEMVQGQLVTQDICVGGEIARFLPKKCHILRHFGRFL
jgi:hypothetical protein